MVQQEVVLTSYIQGNSKRRKRKEEDLLEKNTLKNTLIYW